MPSRELLALYSCFYLTGEYWVEGYSYRRHDRKGHLAALISRAKMVLNNIPEPVQEGSGLWSSVCLFRLIAVERVEYQQSAVQITAGTCIK